MAGVGIGSVRSWWPSGTVGAFGYLGAGFDSRSDCALFGDEALKGVWGPTRGG